MQDLLEISHKVVPVTVIGSGLNSPVDAYTDGQHFFFDEQNIVLVAAHMTGMLDLAGRPVRVERSPSGWHELRGRQVRPLHHRHIAGHLVFRLDDEWLFTVVTPPEGTARPNTN